MVIMLFPKSEGLNRFAVLLLHMIQFTFLPFIISWKSLSVELSSNIYLFLQWLSFNIAMLITKSFFIISSSWGTHLVPGAGPAPDPHPQDLLRVRKTTQKRTIAILRCFRVFPLCNMSKSLALHPQEALPVHHNLPLSAPLFCVAPHFVLVPVLSQPFHKQL